MWSFTGLCDKEPKTEVDMKREHIIRAVAGSLVLISLALGRYHSPYWFLVTLFVGLNLLQSAFTKWCLLEQILDRYGIGR
jgi:hypothetical protein